MSAEEERPAAAARYGAPGLEERQAMALESIAYDLVSIGKHVRGDDERRGFSLSWLLIGMILGVWLCILLDDETPPFKGIRRGLTKP